MSGAPNPPGVDHALAGATVLVNLSASDETTGKDIYRKSLVTGQSGRLICGYIYCSAGDGESTQDVVYSGHNLIAENGSLLAESDVSAMRSIYTELDIARLNEERRRMSTFPASNETYINIEFSLKEEQTELTRFVDPAPFVPGNKADREKRCEEIFMIQAMGLKKRLEHTNAATAVVGISGGLDSTLALLVMVKAFDLLNRDHKDIVAVTMPGFGTTDRTYDNAVSLIKSLGATFREVSIVDSVRTHFRDIGQDEAVHDVTYENGQARERTQILMDIANKSGGMVIEPEICQNLLLVGRLIMAIICLCMVSMLLYRKHWCAIWCAIMRIPAETRHFRRYCMMYWILRSAGTSSTGRWQDFPENRRYRGTI